MICLAAAVEELNTVLAENHQKCGQDTFMLRDAVCDEATNNADCLYDGGDCCLEFKVTTLCKNCSCILTIHLEEMQADFKRLNVKPLANQGKFNALNATSSVKVTDVVSAPVCAVLCLQHDKADMINAWHYHEYVQLCTCGWIQSKHCLENYVQSEWGFGTVLDLDGYSFVQLEKTLPCGIQFRARDTNRV